MRDSPAPADPFAARGQAVFEASGCGAVLDVVPHALELLADLGDLCNQVLRYLEFVVSHSDSGLLVGLDGGGWGSTRGARWVSSTPTP